MSRRRRRILWHESEVHLSKAGLPARLRCGRCPRVLDEYRPRRHPKVVMSWDLIGDTRTTRRFTESDDGRHAEVGGRSRPAVNKELLRAPGDLLESWSIVRYGCLCGAEWVFSATELVDAYVGTQEDGRKEILASELATAGERPEPSTVNVVPGLVVLSEIDQDAQERDRDDIAKAMARLDAKLEAHVPLPPSARVQPQPGYRFNPRVLEALAWMAANADDIVAAHEEIGAFEELAEILEKQVAMARRVLGRHAPGVEASNSTCKPL